ncbi:MAG: ThuA domain-containing protein [Planctomycetia bacterium]|nr:ThuA domain-containing protein [Planctomycetia bacterium]
MIRFSLPRYFQSIILVLGTLMICFSAGPLFGWQQGIIIPMSRMNAEERAKVDAAVPQKSIVPPKKKRKLLVFDVNGKYLGHNSIPWANYAFRAIGQKTGAFEVVLSRNDDDFLADNLSQYDAICFNNVVGTPFVDPVRFHNIVQFVRGGGGLIGIHGSTVAFLMIGDGGEDVFPEFKKMLGAQGANHRSKREPIHVKVEVPGHPITAMFPQDGFLKEDEFFRYNKYYSRKDLRVLLSIDVEKSRLDKDPSQKQERPDRDYGLAWIRRYGKGRVFYSAFAHQVDTFYDPKMLQFYLAGIQYALGDLEAPDDPSEK